MSDMSNTVDRAAWERFSATNKTRCSVCGQRAIVSVTITASELGDSKSMLVSPKATVL